MIKSPKYQGGLFNFFQVSLLGGLRPLFNPLQPMFQDLSPFNTTQKMSRHMRHTLTIMQIHLFSQRVIANPILPKHNFLLPVNSLYNSDSLFGCIMLLANIFSQKLFSESLNSTKQQLFIVNFYLLSLSVLHQVLLTSWWIFILINSHTTLIQSNYLKYI